MANIQTGSLVTNISGSIGGTTFQRGTHGLIARNKSYPPNFNTPDQNYCRALLVQLQTEWQKLSDTQRVTWQAWAKFQNLKSGKFTSIDFYGQEAFIQTNFYSLQNGLTLITDPVFTAYSLNPTAYAFSHEPASLTLNVSTTLVGNVYQPVVQISAPQMSSRNAPSGQLKNCYASYITDNQFSINVDYIKAFGKVPTIGQMVFATIGLIQLSNRALSAFTTSKYVID